MYYKFRPHGVTQWCPALNSTVLSILRQADLPLSRLEWVDADQKLTPEIYQLLIRYGEPADDGLYLDMGYVSAITELEQAKNAHYTFMQLNREFPDLNSPDEQRNLEEMSASTVRDAEKRREDLFSNPISPSLEQHWRTIPR